MESLASRARDMLLRVRGEVDPSTEGTGDTPTGEVAKAATTESTSESTPSTTLKTPSTSESTSSTAPKIPSTPLKTAGTPLDTSSASSSETKAPAASLDTATSAPSSSEELPDTPLETETPSDSEPTSEPEPAAAVAKEAVTQEAVAKEEDVIQEAVAKEEDVIQDDSSEEADNKSIAEAPKPSPQTIDIDSFRARGTSPSDATAKRSVLSEFDLTPEWPTLTATSHISGRALRATDTETPEQSQQTSSSAAVEEAAPVADVPAPEYPETPALETVSFEPSAPAESDSADTVPTELTNSESIDTANEAQGETETVEAAPEAEPEPETEPVADEVETSESNPGIGFNTEAAEDGAVGFASDTEPGEVRHKTNFAEALDAEFNDEPVVTTAPNHSFPRVSVSERPKSVDNSVLDLYADEHEVPVQKAPRSEGGGLGRLMLLAAAVIALLLIIIWLLGAFDTDDSATEDNLIETTESSVAPEADTAPEVLDEVPQDTPETSVAATAAPATSPPTTLPPSVWEVLGDQTGTSQFARFGTPLDLQATLERTTDAEGNPVELTLFAPTDAAVEGLSAEDLGRLTSDPAQAAVLINYHIIPMTLTADDLLGLDGQTLTSVDGLPIEVTVDGDTVSLNGQTRLSAASIAAGNGSVFIIDEVLRPPTINDVLDLGTIQFGPISSRLTDAGATELERAVTFLVENPETEILIAGHTDTDGDADANQGLSERRAVAVRDFLVQRGIAAERLVAQGFGESQPIIVNGVEDKEASRRIEFIVR